MSWPDFLGETDSHVKLLPGAMATAAGKAYPAGKFADFKTAGIETGEIRIFVRYSGSGSPLLLLRGAVRIAGGHFFPEEKPEETAAALSSFFRAP